MSKHKKIIIIFSRIFFLSFLLISIILLGIGISLKVLPLKYLIPLLMVYILILVGFGILVWKKKTRNWLRIVTSIVFILGSLVSAFGLYYLNSTVNLMEKIKSKDYQLEDYYVIALKDSSFKKIQDINEKSMGIYTNQLKNYQTALIDVKSKAEVEEKEYDNFIEAANGLLEEEVDSLLISATNKEMVEDELDDFVDETKIIYMVSLKIENEVVAKEAKVTKEPFNIYISGIDIYGDISSVSRSDVNIVATVNPTTNKILLTTIPRDYYVQLHGTTGYKDKLTHAGIYGINMSVETIEDLLEIDINYYIRVNFTTLISLVDAIGGIEVNNDYAFAATSSNDVFNVGINYLNGKQALAFARERKAFKDGDRQRGKNQQKVLTAIINKASSSKILITKYTDILDSLGNSFQTNIDSNKIYELVNMQLDQMPSWNIESISLNGNDSRNYTYSYPGMTLYVMEPDMATVMEAKNKINEIEQGM